MTTSLRHPHVALTLLLTAGLFFCSSAQAQQRFTNCVTSSLNATVIVPREVQVEIGSGRTLEAGDEIALFTDDGQCVGRSRWRNASFAIAVASTDRQKSIGYQQGARLQYKIWDASEKEVLTLEASYHSCEPETGTLCRSNGRYERNAVYFLSRLATRSSEEAAVYTVSTIFPNPFHDRAEVTLRVAHAQHVTITLYNVLGQRIRRLHDGIVDAGRTYTFTVEGYGLTSGSYFCRIQGETFSTTRRAVLVK